MACLAATGSDSAARLLIFFKLNGQKSDADSVSNELTPSVIDQRVEHNVSVGLGKPEVLLW